MTRIIESLDEIAGAYNALVCDLWGCYHDGLTPLMPAVEALLRYKARGGTVVLLTNAPRPAATVRSFLDAMGAPPESYDGIMSSGEACQRQLRDGSLGSAFAYLGPERDVHLLTDTGRAPVSVAEADTILCTGLRDEVREHPSDYAGEMADWRAAGLRFVCANPDIVVDRGDERLWCAGALGRDYAALGGEVVWFGKPHGPVYAETLALLESLAGRPVERARILAIGDGIQTDIAGGRAAGLDTLFVTGGIALKETAADPAQPDPDRPDPARLHAFLEVEGVSPPYAIGRLR